MLVVEDGRDRFVDERKCGVAEGMCIKLEMVTGYRDGGGTV